MSMACSKFILLCIHHLLRELCFCSVPGWQRTSAGASSMQPSTGSACLGLWSSTIAAMTLQPGLPFLRCAMP